MDGLVYYIILFIIYLYIFECWRSVGLENGVLCVNWYVDVYPLICGDTKFIKTRSVITYFVQTIGAGEK